MDKKNGPSEELYGTKIKSLRVDLDLTQKEVADALHVTPGYISNVENNRTAMSLRVLIYYAKLSGLTLDSLVGLIEPDYSDCAMDNKLTQLIQNLDLSQKEKLYETLKIWVRS